MREIPKKLLVIGGGVIGLELGSVFGRLGTKVEVVEFANRIVPTMDGTMSKELAKVLKKEGFKFHLQHKVQSVTNTEKGVKLTELNKKDDLNRNEIMINEILSEEIASRYAFQEGRIKTSILFDNDVNEAIILKQDLNISPV